MGLIKWLLGIEEPPDYTGGDPHFPYPGAVTHRSTERSTLADGRTQVTTTVQGRGWESRGRWTEAPPSQRPGND